MTTPPSPRSHWPWRRAAHAAVTGLDQAATGLSAQDAPPAKLDPVVVTATRTAERAFDLPVAIDTVTADQIQNGQLQINLSESLARIPGMHIQSRWNYAQDLQLSMRGFGARANFGVRGVRRYQDNIPASMPDGQGQTGSFGTWNAIAKTERPGGRGQMRRRLQRLHDRRLSRPQRSAARTRQPQAEIRRGAGDRGHRDREYALSA